jgi:hypothetical protein
MLRHLEVRPTTSSQFLQAGPQVVPTKSVGLSLEMILGPVVLVNPKTARSRRAIGRLKLRIILQIDHDSSRFFSMDLSLRHVRICTVRRAGQSRVGRHRPAFWLPTVPLLRRRLGGCGNGSAKRQLLRSGRSRPPLGANDGKVLAHRGNRDTASSSGNLDSSGPYLARRQPRLPDWYAVRKVLLGKASEPEGFDPDAANLSNPLVTAGDLPRAFGLDQDLNGNLEEDSVAPKRRQLRIP